jgi:hypothetical protein
MKTSILAAIVASAGMTLTQAAWANPPGRGGFSGGIPHFSNPANFARPIAARPIYGARPGNIQRSYYGSSQNQVVRNVLPTFQTGSRLPSRSFATNSASPDAATTTATTAARNTQNQNNRVSFTEASRRYNHARHDRGWWQRHYSNIVLVDDGYYYWDSGYWYPAWGYDPSYDSYPYDGPIYGFDGLNPDQVVVDVQTQLQRNGYYSNAISGVLDPSTQAAIAAYQQDHNLSITGVVDSATVASLGLT